MSSRVSSCENLPADRQLADRSIALEPKARTAYSKGGKAGSPKCKRVETGAAGFLSGLGMLGALCFDTLKSIRKPSHAPKFHWLLIAAIGDIRDACKECGK